MEVINQELRVAELLFCFETTTTTIIPTSERSRQICKIAFIVGLMSHRLSWLVKNGYENSTLR
jgi:hypothetical protein